MGIISPLFEIPQAIFIYPKGRAPTCAMGQLSGDRREERKRIQTTARLKAEFFQVRIEMLDTGPLQTIGLRHCAAVPRRRRYRSGSQPLKNPKAEPGTVRDFDILGRAAVFP